MRRRFIGGNWKMHGTIESVSALINNLKLYWPTECDAEVVVFPAFVHLVKVNELLTSSVFEWGAQNHSDQIKGAFTGEVSAEMLQDIGCRYVLLGHSERRHVFHEDHAMVARKVALALQYALIPVLCVGETEKERDAGETEKVLEAQLNAVIHQSGIRAFGSMIIAYEPVWAIGTGKVATPEQVQTAHQFIRQLLTKQDEEIAKKIRIIYGGSVKPDNAEAIFNMSDVDGGLIGGASLKAEDFLKICVS